MADPAKFKSVSVSIATYKILKYLGDGKITDADLTVSKTCLLYTSPSPRDRQKSRMPSSA